MFLALLFFFAEPANDVEAAIQKMADVYALVESSYADGVDASHSFYDGAIPAMLRRLDPHSVFFSPDQFQQLKELERSESKGFGTVVSILPGRVIVLQTTPGSPSARAGIEPGDEILAVNGLRLDWLDPEQLTGLLGETRRREVKLDIRRNGSPRILQFSMNPEQMVSPSVDRAFLLPGNVGYLRITAFEGETGKQTKEAIEKLGGAALKGLVLDLRDNPGGVMTAALDVSSLFLAPGKKLVSMRGRARDAEEIEVPASAQPYSFPLAVLINGKSASASEITAGAMQDHDRAVILGEPSYGKGLVQSVFPLPQATGMALTTAFYFTPSGRTIQRPLAEGQLEGQNRWNSLNGGAEFRTDSGRKVRGGGGIEPDHVVQPDAMSRLRIAFDASGMFLNFATEYVRKNPGIKGGFDLSGPLMDEFRVYAAEHRIQPGIAEWSIEQEWIRSRLRQEILTLALGVAKGDEIEMQRDPVVRRALEALQTP